MWGHKLSWVGKAVKWEWISNPSSLEGAVIFRQKVMRNWQTPRSRVINHPDVRVSQGQKGTSDSNTDEREHFSPEHITRHEDGNDCFELCLQAVDGFNWEGGLWLTWETCMSFHYHSYSWLFSIWSTRKEQSPEATWSQRDSPPHNINSLIMTLFI